MRVLIVMMSIMTLAGCGSDYTVLAGKMDMGYDWNVNPSKVEIKYGVVPITITNESSEPKVFFIQIVTPSKLTEGYSAFYDGELSADMATVNPHSIEIIDLTIPNKASGELWVSVTEMNNAMLKNALVVRILIAKGGETR